MDPLRHVKPSVRSLGAYMLTLREAPVKINQNENPWDLPEAVKRRVLEKALARPWSRYPDFDPRELQQPTIVNNIVTFNAANAGSNGGGQGGGLFVATGANPTVRSQDLYGNTPTNVGGSKNDANYIGLDGNVSVDPSFASRTAGARDYRLLASSAMIHVGDAGQTPTSDYDAAPRPEDAGYDGTNIVDMGAYEFSPEFDGDGSVDWQDADDDDDAEPDASDCSPRGKGVSKQPDPVERTLRYEKQGNNGKWNGIARNRGTPTTSTAGPSSAPGRSTRRASTTKTRQPFGGSDAAVKAQVRPAAGRRKPLPRLPQDLVQPLCLCGRSWNARTLALPVVNAITPTNDFAVGAFAGLGLARWVLGDGRRRHVAPGLIAR